MKNNRKKLTKEELRIKYEQKLRAHKIPSKKKYNRRRDKKEF